MNRNKNLPVHFALSEFLTPFDTVFDQIFTSNFPDFTKQFGVDFFGNGAYPRVDIYETGTGVALVAEIPGLTKDQINITVEEGVLSISGEKHSHPLKDKEQYKCIKKELKYSAFKRSFALGEDIDQDSIKAKFKDGILEINFDRFEPKEVKSKKIEIEE